MQDRDRGSGAPAGDRRGSTSRRVVIVGGVVLGSSAALSAAWAAAHRGPASGAAAPVSPATVRPTASPTLSTTATGPVVDAASLGVRPGRRRGAKLASALRSVSKRGGGTLRIARAGVYEVEDVPLASGVTLVLGKGVVLRLPDRSSATSLLRLGDGLRDVAIEGPGTLDGNRRSYRGDVVNRGDLLYADNDGARTAGLRVRGVRFVNAPRSGINIGRGVSDVLVEGCSFTAMTLHAAIAYNSRKVLWRRNTATRAHDRIAPNTPTFQFWVNPGMTVEGPTIVDNRIIGRRGTGAENAFIGIELHGDTGGTLKGGLVARNTISDGSMGVSIAGCTGTVVRDNRISGSDFCGVEIASGHGVKVLENRYRGDGRGSGVRLNDHPVGATVSGNVISGWGDAFDRAGVHSNAQRAVDITIEGNSLSGTYARGAAMYLANISSSRVVGNRIRVASTGRDLYFIDIRANAADADDNTIAKNRIVNPTATGWTNGMISIHAEAGFAAKGNVIADNQLSLAPNGSGVGIGLTSSGSGEVSGNQVARNVLDGTFTERIRRNDS